MSDPDSDAPALLGIDLGSRRIGIAIAESPDGGARPLVTVPRRADPAADALALAELIRRHSVGTLVVGLPLEAAGAEGPMAIEARTWAAAIGERLGLPVVLRDERLSSHVAEGRLAPPRRGRSGGPPSRSQRAAYRARVDREAASVILQDELDARSAGRPGSEP